MQGTLVRYTPPDMACACTGGVCATRSREGWRVGGGVALALLAEALEWFSAPEGLSVLIALGAILLAGRSVVWQGLQSLLARRANIYLLMTLAGVGAIALGKWGEAAVVLTLYALAEWLEQRAAERSERSLRAALELTPAEATVLTADGTWHVRPIDQVRIGDRIRVRPGERVPVDGVVVAGASTVDQSPITGESIPVEKTTGDTVYAGSLNLHGSLEVEAQTTAEQTLVAQIARTVAQAQARRARVDRLMDRFAQVYTPLMLLTAFGLVLVPVLVFGAPFEEWLYRGLMLLVLGCPCALVLSTPITLISALGGLARQGVVVKGAAVIEQTARLRAFAFDKTGTLTYGMPRVELVQSTDTLPESQVLALAYSLALHSEHPIAQAIRTYCQQHKVAPLALEEFQAHPGLGISGTIGTTSYRLGNHQFVEQHNACSKALEATLEQLSAQGLTAVVLFDRQPRAVFALRDPPRPDARPAIQQLHALGIRTVMLTGDAPAPAHAIAKQVGVHAYQAGLLPHEKAAAIESLREQYGAVGMAGDGINDAHALAAADVGLSFAERGSDLAIEAADVLLMRHDLTLVPMFIRTARHAMHIVWQNLVFVMAVRAVFIGLALTGHAALWAAILADMGSTLVVIANGGRAGRTA